MNVLLLLQLFYLSFLLRPFFIQKIQNLFFSCNNIWTQMYHQSLQNNEPFQEDPQLSCSSVQEIQINQNTNQSPAFLRRSVKINTVSSIKSRTDLIKVSKNNDHLKSRLIIQHKELQSSVAYKKQCRICLQDELQGRIIKPCKCTGSMVYVHQHCLCEWIKRKINFKAKAKVHCEVCEEPFDYKILKRLSFSLQELHLNYQRYKSTYNCFFIIMGILLTIWLSFVTLVALGLTQSDGGWVKRSIMQAQQTKIVFICSVIIYLLIMVVIILLFIAQYGIKTEYVVRNIQNYTVKSKKVGPRLYFIAA